MKCFKLFIVMCLFVFCGCNEKEEMADIEFKSAKITSSDNGDDDFYDLTINLKNKKEYRILSIVVNDIEYETSKDEEIKINSKNNEIILTLEIYSVGVNDTILNSIKYVGKNNNIKEIYFGSDMDLFFDIKNTFPVIRNLYVSNCNRIGYCDEENWDFVIEMYNPEEYEIVEILVSDYSFVYPDSREIDSGIFEFTKTFPSKYFSRCSLDGFVIELDNGLKIELVSDWNIDLKPVPEKYGKLIDKKIIDIENITNEYVDCFEYKIKSIQKISLIDESLVYVVDAWGYGYQSNQYPVTEFHVVLDFEKRIIVGVDFSNTSDYRAENVLESEDYLSYFKGFSIDSIVNSSSDCDISSGSSITTRGIDDAVNEIIEFLDRFL